MRKSIILFLFPLVHCLVFYNTTPIPESPQSRTVYFDEVQLRDHSREQPISHDPTSPIWMKVDLKQVSETNPYYLTSCILSGLSLSILPGYTAEEILVQFELRVPGTTILETVQTEVDQNTVLWMPFVFADPGAELDESAIWKPASQASNAELVAAIDRVKRQINARKNRIRSLESNPDKFPVLVLGAGYFNSNRFGLNTLNLALKNNSSKTIKNVVLYIVPEQPAETTNINEGQKSGDTEPAGIKVVQDIPGVHYAGPLLPGESTEVLRFGNHYIGDYYPDARLDRLKIIFADDESIILEGDAAARLVIESPLSPAEVLEDKKSFSHFKL
ncbi:MAG TPA: hypothetical protein DEA96_09250 [Leptospiraceae bacterium]|nr:hypothetical protein [Spirochaetaceae bacterium]HBS05139.1 hypothetical protein [Leptospiraceae bacterium]